MLITVSTNKTLSVAKKIITKLRTITTNKILQQLTSTCCGESNITVGTRGTSGTQEVGILRTQGTEKNIGNHGNSGSGDLENP